MGKASTVLRIILIGAFTLGVLPIVTTAYVYISGQELPAIWNLLTPILVFVVSWLIVSVCVWSIKMQAKVSRM